MTNFEKCKENFAIKDGVGGYMDFCRAIHRTKGETNCHNRSCRLCGEWLKQEYKPQILDKAEKKYLSNIIRPFRKGVLHIKKASDNVSKDKEYIVIHVKEYNGITSTLVFPYFDRDTMYKGMQKWKEYTLKELGL